MKMPSIFGGFRGRPFDWMNWEEEQAEALAKSHSAGKLTVISYCHTVGLAVLLLALGLALYGAVTSVSGERVIWNGYPMPVHLVSVIGVVVFGLLAVYANRMRIAVRRALAITTGGEKGETNTTSERMFGRSMKEAEIEELHQAVADRTELRQIVRSFVCGLRDEIRSNAGETTASDYAFLLLTVAVPGGLAYFTVETVIAENSVIYAALAAALLTLFVTINLNTPRTMAIAVFASFLGVFAAIETSKLDSSDAVSQAEAVRYERIILDGFVTMSELRRMAEAVRERTGRSLFEPSKSSDEAWDRYFAMQEAANRDVIKRGQVESFIIGPFPEGAVLTPGEVREVARQAGGETHAALKPHSWADDKALTAAGARGFAMLSDQELFELAKSAEAFARIYLDTATKVAKGAAQ